jgi:hypothetical protein
VDKYLAAKLCEKRPENIKVAMSRLCLGLNHSVQVCQSRMRVKASVETLWFRSQLKMNVVFGLG